MSDKKIKMVYFIKRRYPPSFVQPVFVEGVDARECDDLMRDELDRANADARKREKVSPYYCPSLN